MSWSGLSREKIGISATKTHQICADLQRLKRDSDSGRSAAAADKDAGRGTAAKRWQRIIFAGAIAAMLAIAGFWYFIPRAPALTDKDMIVLSHFDNKTGDSVFDDTLKQGLSVQLEQSPFLALLEADGTSRR